jgi:simple sugar transport system permease protein
MKIIVEKRERVSIFTQSWVLLFSVVLALIVVGMLLVFIHTNPIEAYSRMFIGAFGSKFAITETIVKSIPLILMGAGLALAFKMNFWNIGAEGQFHMGAIAGTWVAYNYLNHSPYMTLTVMFLFSFLAGGLWLLIPALLKVYLNINEIITTLLMNYIAIFTMIYLVYGPWKDPTRHGFPFTPLYPENARLPIMIPGTRIHLGIVFAIVFAFVIWFLLNKTSFGYEIKLMGKSVKAAKYIGINFLRNTILIALISGGMAGIAGMSEVSGIIHMLQRQISPGYGYTAIIIAFLSILDPLTIIFVSIFIAGLLVSGDQLQIMMNLPIGIVYILQATILIFLLAGQTLMKYKIKMSSGKERSL